jgi:hypothetical protein
MPVAIRGQVQRSELSRRLRRGHFSEDGSADARQRFEALRNSLGPSGLGLQRSFRAVVVHSSSVRLHTLCGRCWWQHRL